MGKKVKNPRIHIISFRLTLEERQAIEAATRGKMSVGEFARRATDMTAMVLK